MAALAGLIRSTLSKVPGLDEGEAQAKADDLFRVSTALVHSAGSGPDAHTRGWYEAQLADYVLKNPNEAAPSPALSVLKLGKLLEELELKTDLAPSTKLGALSLLLALSRPTRPPAKSGVDDGFFALPTPPTALETGPPAEGLAPRLAAFRLANEREIPRPLSDTELCESVMFLLQGIDARYVRFTRSASQAMRAYLTARASTDRELQRHYDDSTHTIIQFDVPRERVVSAPAQTLVHRIAALGAAFRVVDDAVHREPTPLTLTQQSVRASLVRTLSAYHRFVSSLEARVRAEAEPSLKKVLLLAEPMRREMFFAAELSTFLGPERGDVLSVLDARARTGDPFIQRLSTGLLEHIAVPFFRTLADWTFKGELHDPFGEFFVASGSGEAFGNGVEAGGERRNAKPRTRLVTPSAARPHSPARLVTPSATPPADPAAAQDPESWENKFVFLPERLPSFLDEAFARKIFSTGKSLNFIKYTCKDPNWVIGHTGTNTTTLQYADMDGLQSSLSEAYRIASQRLLDIYFGKFHLLQHLVALKDYMLLGKGDFVETLMESLGPSLSRPANALYRHNMTTALESAVNGAAIRRDALPVDDVLKCLDVRMLPFTQGELGWDVFTLEYKVESPLSTVLDAGSLNAYLQLFQHLWHIKRVQWELDALWRRLMTGSRGLMRVPELNNDLQRARLALSEMIFFVRQLQYYCHLEVIGCSWQMLEDFCTKREGDLDGLIEAHRAYLDRLVTKAMFVTHRSSKSSKKETMLEQLTAIFRTLLLYRESADALCSYALALASRAETAKDISRGIYTSTTEAKSSPADQERLKNIRHRLETYSADFRRQTVALVISLGQSRDLDMRFLSVRLNFNYWFVNPSKQET